jgi:hypothetical protein
LVECFSETLAADGENLSIQNGRCELSASALASPTNSSHQAERFHIVGVWAVVTVFACFLMASARH